MLPLMVASASLMRSADTSWSLTSKPASAQTCAMPLPIWPAPITPTLRMLCAMCSLLPKSRRSFTPIRCDLPPDCLVKLVETPIV